MRCKVCDYRLWNLKARQCPECGTGFRISDYEFVPNSVQFCCPHCGQAYYGTGPKGHLVPEAFCCVKCAQPVHMNEMVLLPTEGLDEEQTAAVKMPWLDRSSRGWFRAWFATIGMAMVSPGRMMQAVPVETGTATAWWFAFMTTSLVMLCASLPGIAMMATMGIAGAFPGAGPVALAPVGMVLGFGLGAIGAAMLYLLLWGPLTHGLLRLTGRTEHGLGRTYQALCFASGANALTAVPCMGQYIGPIWWLVSGVIAVKEAQRVHGGRAAFAVLTGPILFTVAAIGLYMWFIFWSMTAFPATAGGGVSVGPGQVLTIQSGLQTYAAANAGQLPVHAIQLVEASAIQAGDLVIPTSLTGLADVPVGRTNLDVFRQLPPERRSRDVQAVVANTPAGLVAHRLGDFVFTYHGINLNNADPALWLLIEWPDPAVNGAVRPNDTVHVGLGAGRTSGFSANLMQSELARQNALRAQYGLPPLPMPETVLHGQPAAGPGAASLPAEAPDEGGNP